MNPIAKAIAERIRGRVPTEYAGEYGHGLEVARDAIADQFSDGDFDDLLPPANRPTLSDSLINDLYEGALSDVWEHGGSDQVRCNNLSEVYELAAAMPHIEDATKLRQHAAELRAWEEWQRRDGK